LRPAGGAAPAGLAGIRRSTTPSTSWSTIASMAAASPVALHPPRASAFWKARTSLLPAFARQRASTGTPRPNADEWHLIPSAAFLPAALIFATAHFTAGPPGPAPGARGAHERPRGGIEPRLDGRGVAGEDAPSPRLDVLEGGEQLHVGLREARRIDGRGLLHRLLEAPGAVGRLLGGD